MKLNIFKLLGEAVKTQHSKAKSNNINAALEPEACLPCVYDAEMVFVICHVVHLVKLNVNFYPVCCLYSPFKCISFHEFSRQLSVFLLCSSGLISLCLIGPFNYISPSESLL